MPWWDSITLQKRSKPLVERAPRSAWSYPQVTAADFAGSFVSPSGFVRLTLVVARVRLDEPRVLALELLRRARDPALREQLGVWVGKDVLVARREFLEHASCDSAGRRLGHRQVPDHALAAVVGEAPSSE